MARKSPTLNSGQLIRLLATAVRTERRELVTAIRILSQGLTKMERRLAKAEGKIERQATSLRVHRGAHKPRKNKRYVAHKISRAEKAHLCEVWATNHRDPDKLAAEGKVLAKRYKLHYQRQVVRWFRRFESWARADISALIKSRAE